MARSHRQSAVRNSSTPRNILLLLALTATLTLAKPFDSLDKRAQVEQINDPSILKLLEHTIATSAQGEDGDGVEMTTEELEEQGFVTQAFQLSSSNLRVPTSRSKMITIGKEGVDDEEYEDKNDLDLEDMAEQKESFYLEDYTEDYPGFHRRALYNNTEQSNECKYCIDNANVWCPTSNYGSGYCCLPTERCPSAGKCSTDYFEQEQKYWLCPNEVGCLFSRTLTPPSNGDSKLYEKLEGKFVQSDLCSFKIAIPSSTDLNDMMYLRVEWLDGAKATLLKATSLEEPISRYNLGVGQTFTATQGINFYLLFEALEISSGEFVFTIWYKTVPGAGSRQPITPTIPDDQVEPEPEPVPETKPETNTNTDTNTNTNTNTDSGSSTTDNSGTNTNSNIADGSKSTDGDSDSGAEVIGGDSKDADSSSTDTTDKRLYNSKGEEVTVADVSNKLSGGAAFGVTIAVIFVCCCLTLPFAICCGLPMVAPHTKLSQQVVQAQEKWKADYADRKKKKLQLTEEKTKESGEHNELVNTESDKDMGTEKKKSMWGKDKKVYPATDCEDGSGPSARVLAGTDDERMRGVKSGSTLFNDKEEQKVEYDQLKGETLINGPDTIEVQSDKPMSKSDKKNFASSSTDNPASKENATIATATPNSNVPPMMPGAQPGAMPFLPPMPNGQQMSPDQMQQYMVQWQQMQQYMMMQQMQMGQQPSHGESPSNASFGSQMNSIQGMMLPQNGYMMGSTPMMPGMAPMAQSEYGPTGRNAANDTMVAKANPPRSTAPPAPLNFMPTVQQDSSMTSGVRDAELQDKGGLRDFSEVDRSHGNHGSKIITASLNDVLNDSQLSGQAGIPMKAKKVKKVKKKRKLVEADYDNDADVLAQTPPPDSFQPIKEVAAENDAVPSQQQRFAQPQELADKPALDFDLNDLDLNVNAGGEAQMNHPSDGEKADGEEDDFNFEGVDILDKSADKKQANNASINEDFF